MTRPALWFWDQPFDQALVQTRTVRDPDIVQLERNDANEKRRREAQLPAEVKVVIDGYLLGNPKAKNKHMATALRGSPVKDLIAGLENRTLSEKIGAYRRQS